jgi:hypothetical protein
MGRSDSRWGENVYVSAGSVTVFLVVEVVVVSVVEDASEADTFVAWSTIAVCCTHALFGQLQNVVLFTLPVPSVPKVVEAVPCSRSRNLVYDSTDSGVVGLEELRVVRRYPAPAYEPVT